MYYLFFYIVRNYNILVNEISFFKFNKKDNFEKILDFHPKLKYFTYRSYKIFSILSPMVDQNKVENLKNKV